jgi:coenzyme F420-0:L-glutamate ligase/coenzyme F420-1:gamma-L-glutamate ligase
MNRRGRAMEAILSRRSVRRFSDRAPSNTIIESVVEAGRRAPSPHNSQPWLFFVISSGQDKRELASAMKESYLEYLQSQDDADGPEKAEKAYARTVSAPVLILLCLDRRQLKDQPTAVRRRGEWLMGTQGLAAAAENMLLAAHAQGLGGCWRGAPIFSSQAIRRCLRLPAKVEPQVLLELGHPSGAPRRKRLKAKDEVVRNGLGRR